MIDSFLTFAAEGDGLMRVINNFGVDLRVIVAHAINFTVVALALYHLAYKPVVNTMETRQDTIEKGLNDAAEAKKRLSEANREREEMLRDARQEAQRILSEYKDKAKVHYDQQVSETAGKIEEMTQKARESNELERKKMLSEVRQEVARLVVLTSSKVLRKDLSDQERQRLNESATQELAQL